MLINRGLSIVFNSNQIIADCLAGRSGAFEKLYTNFSGKMYGICLRYSNNSDDAKDILQEGWIKVFEKLDQFKNTGSFEGWIRKIMINTALEKYRSLTKLNNLIREETIGMEEPETDDVITTISVDDLLNLLQKLTPQYRIVFNLYAIEGYSHKEIGEMLNISEGTSKSNLSRARVILQKKVLAYYLEEKQVI